VLGAEDGERDVVFVASDAGIRAFAAVVARNFLRLREWCENDKAEDAKHEPRHPIARDARSDAINH